MKFIKDFKDLNASDVPLVGGKNASLGQMISQLSSKGIRVPMGFAVTAEAYWHFVAYNQLLEPMKAIMAQFDDPNDIKKLKTVGSQIRTLFYEAQMPDDIKIEIEKAYADLCGHYDEVNCDVAVRSSATAEDLPTASFAGQQETFLNIRGADALIKACKKSMASLFTDRAIIYRIEQGFDHFQVALSIGIQKMVRSDLASAGVIFTLDTETGFENIILINSSYGLGEAVVKGEVIPDEFFVYKPTLEKGFASIVKKSLGDKRKKIIYAKEGDKTTQTVDTSVDERNSFSLTDDEIIELAKYSLIIEDHYTSLKHDWSPMDIEWAKDGIDGKLYILQARPETVHAVHKKRDFLKVYTLQDADKTKKNILVSGQSIGSKITSGKAKIITSILQIDEVQVGDILVTDMTDPDWVPAMKKAAGIITNRGGRTCHAAIVSRELNIPAIVGAHSATEKIKSEQEITMECSRGKTGYVYEGIIPFKEITIPISKLTTDVIEPDVMINIADPDSAFAISFLPNDGVGLARIEFIISNSIKIHPLALIHPQKIIDPGIIKKIAWITRAYEDKKSFYIDNLAYGIGTIACAFYPKPVIVRFSDFKSNEYRNLIGGTYFEPVEENPMLGFRGASRYYNERFKPAFALECEAIKKVRNIMGLKNVKVMVPFVRMIEEAEKVLRELEQNDLKRGQDDLEIVMMCEIPSNALLIDQFCTFFDGFSIGSNDLTQLTLGVDRDSEIVAYLFDERNQAVKKIIEISVEGALKHSRYIGICGQAPSDLPEIVKFLIDLNISSISLNPDAVAPFLMRYQK